MAVLAVLYCAAGNLSPVNRTGVALLALQSCVRVSPAPRRFLSVNDVICRFHNMLAHHVTLSQFLLAVPYLLCELEETNP
jgi:hypothetical protein